MKILILKHHTNPCFICCKSMLHAKINAANLLNLNKYQALRKSPRLFHIVHRGAIDTFITVNSTGGQHSVSLYIWCTVVCKAATFCITWKIKIARVKFSWILGFKKINIFWSLFLPSIFTINNKPAEISPWIYFGPIRQPAVPVVCSWFVGFLYWW